MRQPIRSIAIVNPLGDYGISGYTFELAEALGVNGVQVDAYVSGASSDDFPPPMHHRRLPVLGSALIKQRDILTSSRKKQTAEIRRKPKSGPYSLRTRLECSAMYCRLRSVFLRLELPLYLKAKGYDVVWTQWPDMSDYGSGFWRACKLLGMHVVHTVHNVLPHEESAFDRTMCGKVYLAVERLFVHSDWSRKELLRTFPSLDGRVALMRHGLFSIYGRRAGAREDLRKRLGIADDQVALLFCGAIRPYKNIDSVITALKDKRCRNVVLVVSGKESSYSPASASEPLSRTRRLAEKEGVLDRIKLLPGFLKRTEMAELFEAGDAVVLPYIRGYGSGMLLLGMAFEKHILSTEAGGAEEYLKPYGRYTLLRGPTAADVAEGIYQFLEGGRLETPADTSALAWANIARQALDELNETFR